MALLVKGGDLRPLGLSVDARLFIRPALQRVGDRLTRVGSPLLIEPPPFLDPLALIDPLLLINFSLRVGRRRV